MMAFENFLRNVPQQTLHQSASAFGQPPNPDQTKPSDVVSEAAGGRGKGQARPHRPQGGPQRSLSLRQREEVQALLRQIGQPLPGAPRGRAPSRGVARLDLRLSGDLLNCK